MQLFNLKSNQGKRRFLRKNMTKAEVVLWQKLKGKNLGYKFRRQFGVGPYIVDFYCPQIKLGIEIDGGVHAFKSAQIRDKIRQKFLESKDLYVKRYWNSEILNNCDSVIEDILVTCAQIDNLKKNEYFEPFESPPKIRGRLQPAGRSFSVGR
ncbi:MAG: endonuclease domain-containing protein, partial [Candidatus Parcubacteria bacterium]|nr:endonuclease domain-containing protein [Candidatus Parcubacteria bacterium]